MVKKKTPPWYGLSGCIVEIFMKRNKKSNKELMCMTTRVSVLWVTFPSNKSTSVLPKTILSAISRFKSNSPLSWLVNFLIAFQVQRICVKSIKCIPKKSKGNKTSYPCHTEGNSLNVHLFTKQEALLTLFIYRHNETEREWATAKKRTVIKCLSRHNQLINQICLFCMYWPIYRLKYLMAIKIDAQEAV
jgi:hypothetical protein